MIIDEEFGNDYYSNLIIQNYPNLQSIVVKKNSLKNLNSLKICNCEKLKTIKVEDCGFHNVKNVIIESIWLFYFDDYIFLSYKHLLQEINHSGKQQVYLCQVILSNSTLVYIFLIYNHLKQENIHSVIQQVYLCQVILFNSILVYIFLIYNHSKQEKDHSLKQQVYLYQVEYSYSCSCRYSIYKWRIQFHVI